VDYNADSKHIKTMFFEIFISRKIILKTGGGCRPNYWRYNKLNKPVRQNESNRLTTLRESNEAEKREA